MKRFLILLIVSGDTGIGAESFLDLDVAWRARIDGFLEAPSGVQYWNGAGRNAEMTQLTSDVEIVRWTNRFFASQQIS